MHITCMCNVEKNGYMDKEIQTRDRNKILQVFKLTKSGGENEPPQPSELRFMLKYQKTMDLALEFRLRDISGVFSQGINQGLLTITLSMKPPDENSQGQSNASTKTSLLVQRNVMLGSTCMSGLAHLTQSSQPQYKVFLSKMEP